MSPRRDHVLETLRKESMSLFDEAEADHLESNKPLAARMRPRVLTEFAGQQQLLGEGKLLRRMIDARQLGSILFFGPPGTGKTTLAELLAHETGGRFHSLSAVLSGVKELREVLSQARDDVAAGAPRPILFIDEIHRFNKSQQDALLPDVEAGIVTLVGATTSNPYFAINAALISRSQVFQFEPLNNDDIVDLLQRAIRTPQRGLGDIPIEAEPEALQYIATMVEGDARKALGALEIGVLSSSQRPVRFDLKLASESLQQKSIRYDGSGDEHYDMASALIKSLRGSDPDASLYWLARMLEGGEDIRFLCRRLVILASEDIGNADPQALPLAVAAMQACEFIGLPECQLTLSQTVIYLALAPKSNSATTAIGNARQEVRKGDLVPVPVALRDKHYQGARDLGHGEGYLYAHNHPDGIAAMDYLGIDREFYTPSGRGFEEQLAARLLTIREKLKQAK
ncbi:Replication-associated recombination protein A [Rosistilla carotiformis]|uniref:Replication-associated recombination protein A n=2 Tax=Rosistilla carotiformis TaxID=2528017 RepID=A0A518JXP1_9BACT|nr:Replication-associated recombination protein A [Rosistilla carotiformis]